MMWLMSCLCGVLLGGDLALYNSDTCHPQPAFVPRVIFVWLSGLEWEGGREGENGT